MSLPAAARAMAMALLLAAVPAAAQLETPSGTEIGRYVVRPGDTLEAISARYSGGRERWSDNWKLNPQVTDPHRIEPGVRLRILLAGPVPPATARLTRLSPNVEERPSPIDWSAAEVDDLLRAEDGIRTLAKASAEMRFSDGSALRMTESSLLFLRRVGRRLEAVDRDEIEIVEGQADLETTAAVPGAPGIDIILGTTRAAPQPGADGTLATRARKADDGGAQLMVYEGESTVEAGGATVEVASGMGTTVAEGEPPAPPEELLAAPALLSPPQNAAYGFANPGFSWQPVTGAASYTVEVCRDPDCAALVERVLGLEVPRWAPARLPIGSFHWRATAVAPSGLDGYPGTAVAFAVTSDQLDRAPPGAGRRVTGRQLYVGDALVLGPDAEIEITAEDDASGVAGWRYALDGRQVDAGSWSSGWEAGEHRAEATVLDHAGNHTAIEPLAFVSDPEPPQASWLVGPPDQMLADYGEDRARGISERRSRRVLAEWSSDGARWVSLSTGRGRRSTLRPGERRTVGRYTADHPQILLRATRRDPLGTGAPVALPPGQLLRISFEDAHSGVAELTFGLGRTGSGDGLYLWFEARDLVDNVTTFEWPLAVEVR